MSFCLIQDGFHVCLVVVMVAFFAECVSLKEGECCPFFRLDLSQPRSRTAQQKFSLTYGFSGESL